MHGGGSTNAAQLVQATLLQLAQQRRAVQQRRRSTGSDFHATPCPPRPMKCRQRFDGVTQPLVMRILLEVRLPGQPGGHIPEAVVPVHERIVVLRAQRDGKQAEPRLCDRLQLLMNPADPLAIMPRERPRTERKGLAIRRFQTPHLGAAKPRPRLDGLGVSYQASKACQHLLLHQLPVTVFSPKPVNLASPSSH